MKDFNTWLKDNNLYESLDDAKKASEKQLMSKEQLKRCQDSGKSITASIQKKRQERRNKNRPNYLG